MSSAGQGGMDPQDGRPTLPSLRNILNDVLEEEPHNATYRSRSQPHRSDDSPFRLVPAHSHPTSRRDRTRYSQPDHPNASSSTGWQAPPPIPSSHRTISPHPTRVRDPRFSLTPIPSTSADPRFAHHSPGPLYRSWSSDVSRPDVRAHGMARASSEAMAPERNIAGVRVSASSANYREDETGPVILHYDHRSAVRPPNRHRPKPPHPDPTQPFSILEYVPPNDGGSQSPNPSSLAAGQSNSTPGASSSNSIALPSGMTVLPRSFLFISHDGHEAEPRERNNTARYECPYCQKRFGRPSSLKIHINHHTGEKPFQCTYPGCSRSFSVHSNMRRHLRIHTAVSAFESVDGATSATHTGTPKPEPSNLTDLSDDGDVYSTDEEETSEQDLI